jgi:hypothetical protein
VHALAEAVEYCPARQEVGAVRPEVEQKLPAGHAVTVARPEVEQKLFVGQDVQNDWPVLA